MSLFGVDSYLEVKYTILRVISVYLIVTYFKVAGLNYYASRIKYCAY